MQNLNNSQNNVTRLYGPEIQMPDPLLIDLLTYWEGLRAGRLAPKRSEIDPRAIQDMLAYTFILEHTRLNEFRFRLVGAKICDRMGMELRAMPGYALIRPDDRAQFGDALADMIRKPQVIQLQLGGKDRGRAQMLLLPMCDETGQVNRILGCISMGNSGVSLAGRFSIIRQKATRIIADKPTLAPAISGFAEPVSPFDAEQPEQRNVTGDIPADNGAKGKTRPYLRLVKND